ncbi:ppsC, partial [Symbiodinium sp. KB8]
FAAGLAEVTVQPPRFGHDVFSVASHPAEHRESLPLSLSFVLYLEKCILDPHASHAEILRIGYLLLCVWGSLRCGDALWCPPSRLHYQPQSHALVGICLRTKTTKRGMPVGILAAGLCGTSSQCWSLRFLSVLRQAVADTLALNPQRHLDFLPLSLSGSEARPIISAPLKRESMVLWLRGLLLKHWRLLSQDPAPAAFGLVAAHSLKCTLLSWARQLHLDSDLRRIQGHHRQSGSDRSASLYSRDDILPMLRLQRLVVDAVRSGFLPLQPMARGLAEPLPELPVTLPSSASLPELGPLSDDCLPEALPARPCLPVEPSPQGDTAGASDADTGLESLSSESSESSADEVPLQDAPSAPAAPKAAAPPPSASVSAFGFLWNARSNVVHVAMQTEPSALRSKSFEINGSTVWLRPLCGARTHQPDTDSFCAKAPADAIFCRGDDVFGESPGCLKVYNAGPGALLTPKPTSWSFEEACCMPVIFVTVEEALGDLAQLKRGERVLIHAAAGGVGLVAIQYAQFVGAEVYATAGADEKHQFLRSMGVKYITSSRNGAKFEDDMKAFLAEAGDDGIDVVLNSLSHDDYIPRSLALLRKGGRFMEIGKRGIWSHEQMFEARPDVMYEKIAADTMMDKEPWRYNGYMKRLISRVDEGGLKPINMHVFDGMETGVKAMQFLQRAQNIGKVVISQASTLALKQESHYVLSGGMGALGMVTAQYLLEEGAKSMTLLSRSGRPSADITELWKALQDSSVELQASPCDIGVLDAVQSLAQKLREEKKQTAGLIHLAAVLDDATLPKLTRGHLERSYGAKVWGARHLRFCLQSLPWDFALLFSSTSALLGSPGPAFFVFVYEELDLRGCF